MENANAEHQLRIMKIIWVVFLVSQASFLAAIIIVKKDVLNVQTTNSLFGEAPIATIFLAFLAVINLAISFFIKSLGIKKATAERNPKLLQSTMILSLAFCESVSIMGLILALAFNYKYFFLWFVAAIVGIVVHFPRRRIFLAMDAEKI